MKTSSYRDRVRAFVITASFLLFFVCLSGLAMTLSNSSITHFDFRTQYTSGYMVRTGHARQLFDYEATRQMQNEKVSKSDKALPFIHLAYEALLYVPLSFVGYKTAYFLFLAINLAFLMWAAALMKPYLLPLSEIWEPLPIAIFVCFLPVAMTLIEGQNSLLLLVAFVFVFIKLDRGHEFAAGLILGLASIKFQYVIPVALLFLVWRRWKFVAGVALSSLALVAISMYLTGINAFLSYLHLLGNMSTGFSAQTGATLGIRPELMPNIRGLVYAAGGASLVSTVVTVVFSASVFLWAARRRASFPLALLAALLVSYHETFTDATLLILPIGWATVQAYKSARARSANTLAMCAVLLAAPVVLLMSGVRFYLLALPAVGLLLLWNDNYTPEAAPGTDSVSV